MSLPRDEITSPDAGFSLIEALVALAVFALAGVGLIMVQTQSAASHQALETRTLAGVVAQNILVESAAAAIAPPVGARSGAVTLAGRNWQFSVEVAPTPDPRTRRVRVQVRDEANRIVGAERIAFIAATEEAAP